MSSEWHLLGHATWLIEAGDQRILFDPVLGDPFEDGAVETCPRRIVDAGCAGAATAVVLSHAHPDHFDIPSLVQLSRDLPVYVPADPLLQKVLAGLGFTRVTEICDHRPFAIGDLEFTPTPSLLHDPIEHGFLVAGADGRVWNQVDSGIDSALVSDFTRRHGVPQVHLAAHAVQNFGFFDTRRAEFPVAEHAANLAHIAAIGAPLVVPAAAGFCFAPPHDWLNPFLFPVSRRRFLRDADAVLGPGRARAMDPGDVLRLTQGHVSIGRAVNRYARCVGGREPLQFDPAAPVPPLIDPDHGQVGEAQLATFCAALLDELERFARVYDDPALAAWRAANVHYRLALVLPSGRVCGRTLQFTPAAIRAIREEDAADADALDHDMSLTIASSLALALLRGKVSPFLLRAYRRTTNTSCAVAVHDDQLRAHPLPYLDLLWTYRNSSHCRLA